MTNFQTDWLSTNSVFYHTSTKKISANINEVIDFEHFEWDQEGLENYLNFGFSVFEKTPIKYVHFLPANAQIDLINHQLVISQKQQDEAILAQLEQPSRPEAVMELIKSKISYWQNQAEGTTILPLSGGLDSRLMLQLLPDKPRVKAFTYSVGAQQEANWEVVNAKYIAEKMGIRWEQVFLGSFFNLIEDWYKDFGVSTHLHGMYQMEFYQNIRQHHQKDTHLLSGMVGDIWAGNIMESIIKHPKELLKLGYIHNWNADIAQLTHKPKINQTNIEFFEKKEKYLAHPLFSVIETVRLKSMLLKYLLRVPEKMSFMPYAPFIDQEIVLAMLSLPTSERLNRKWQRDYLDKYQLGTDKLNIKRSYQNDIHQFAAFQTPLKPLSGKLLREIIDTSYIEKINQNILNNFSSKVDYFLFKYLGTTKGLRRFIKNKFDLYFAPYSILYPLQRIIEQRNEYFASRK